MRRCKRPHCVGSMAGRPKQAKYHSRQCGQAHHAHIVAGTTVRLVAPRVESSMPGLGKGSWIVWLEGQAPEWVEADSRMQAKTRVRMRYSRRK